jgi:peptide/nickel transport system ATP-binding protein
MTPILRVENYTLDYLTAAGPRRVLNRVSLAVAPGEVLGLVGESGSGKTSLAWAIMRYLPGNARERGGTVLLNNQDLTRLDHRYLLNVRGRHIGMVFQDPATSLNPTLTLGRQLTEVLERHRRLPHAAARREALELLRHVDLRNPNAIMRRYPHEVSGGEKQRVVIATAFACRPDLIIFDEPTTALDVITGARILDLFLRLRAETGVAGLYISHDLALVSRIADRVAVIERGEIKEQGPAKRIFVRPGDAATRRLVDAVPRPDRRLVHDVPEPRTLLETDDVTVRYGRSRLFLRRHTMTGAHDVRLQLREKEILGLVGESGSGKSTIARALTGLTRFEGGIRFRGKRIASPQDMDREYRRDVQVVFQHPDSSLNPRQRVSQILGRPLRLFGASLAQIHELLMQVGLPSDYVDRYPHQLSGGEKQRVAIARAFAARPSLVICDEITASLDVSVQATVIETLLALRSAYGTAFLFITHDLNLVRQIAHRVAVMRQGELVDDIPVQALQSGSTHPYTRALMDASPIPVG